MAIGSKLFLTADKTSGTGNAVINITAAANTGGQRTDTITVTTKGGIVKTVSIVQKAVKNVFILALNTKNNTSYTIEVFKQNSSGGYSASSYDELMTYYEYGTLDEVKLSWSPFDGFNICNYSCIIDPSEVTNGIVRLSLNQVTDPTATGIPTIYSDRYYDMWNAAFFSGSPIVFLDITRDTKQYAITTLYDYVKSKIGYAYVLNVTTENAGSGTANMYGSIASHQICKEGAISSCLISYSNDYIKYAARDKYSNGNRIPYSTGITKVNLIVGAGSIFKPKIYKWVLGKNGIYPWTMNFYIVGESYASFRPTYTKKTETFMKGAYLHSSAVAVQEGNSVTQTLEYFYNPTYEHPLTIIK